MRTVFGVLLIIGGIALAIILGIIFLPEHATDTFMFWFLLSVVVFVAAAGVLGGALLIERDRDLKN